jgi:hypothetical protein
VSRSNSDGWPEPSSDGAGQPDNKDSWPVTTQSSSAAFTDLVPEFEPGKPWKVIVLSVEAFTCAHGTCKQVYINNENMIKNISEEGEIFL